MARATTIQALRNRGISKKTATILADAGFTLEKLAASKVDRLTKFLPKKEAEKVLKKLGAAPPAETKPAPKKEKAKPAARGRKPTAKAEAEPETPLTIPVKAPPLTAGEQEIMDGLKEVGRWLPPRGSRVTSTASAPSSGPGTAASAVRSRLGTNRLEG